MLNFDINNLVWALINIVLFYVLMRLFLFKPIKKTIEKRKELIENQFKEAEEKEKSANELYDEYQAQLSGVDKEKKEILAEARANAKNEYNKIVKRAETEADKLKEDAKRSSRLESEKARLAVKEEIAQLAMDTAEKIIGENVSAKTDSDIYDKFLNEGSEESSEQ